MDREIDWGGVDQEKEHFRASPSRLGSPRGRRSHIQCKAADEESLGDPPKGRPSMSLNDIAVQNAEEINIHSRNAYTEFTHFSLNGCIDRFPEGRRRKNIGAVATRSMKT